MTRALLLIDLQYDFMPGGALPTVDGHETVPVANRLLDSCPCVMASQDWHPPDHRSFASQHPDREPGEVIDLDGVEQILWPDHCVQDSRGAELHDDLRTDAIERVIRKGTDRRVDSYSAFYDNQHRHDTGLADALRARGITALDILGLATDVCVKFSVFDAIAEGFAVRVVAPGCRPVEQQEGDGERALAAMAERGAEVLDRLPE